MAPKKTNRKYYFTVEGETAGWYLDWLKQLIHQSDAVLHTVTIDWKKEKIRLSGQNR